MVNYFEEVINVIKNNASDVVITDSDIDTPLKELGVDSLDMASILLELEEKINIDFLEEDIENLNTINLIVKFINENINQQ